MIPEPPPSVAATTPTNTISPVFVATVLLTTTAPDTAVLRDKNGTVRPALSRIRTPAKAPALPWATIGSLAIMKQAIRAAAGMTAGRTF